MVIKIQANCCGLLKKNMGQWSLGENISSKLQFGFKVHGLKAKFNPFKEIFLTLVLPRFLSVKNCESMAHTSESAPQSAFFTSYTKDVLCIFRCLTICHDQLCLSSYTICFCIAKSMPKACLMCQVFTIGS